VNFLNAFFAVVIWLIGFGIMQRLLRQPSDLAVAIGVLLIPALLWSLWKGVSICFQSLQDYLD